MTQWATDELEHSASLKSEHWCNCPLGWPPSSPISLELTRRVSRLRFCFKAWASCAAPGRHFSIPCHPTGCRPNCPKSHPILPSHSSLHFPFSGNFTSLGQTVHFSVLFYPAFVPDAVQVQRQELQGPVLVQGPRQGGGTQPQRRRIHRWSVRVEGLCRSNACEGSDEPS